MILRKRARSARVSLRAKPEIAGPSGADWLMTEPAGIVSRRPKTMRASS
ncbi:MAG: hypothetical protein AVDCRST_MAG85-3408 [uncultured Solirubrobacteraceae bacterium]|uniref:Uncharacterized protein n=1 Tax=uncultured Solirubrobacteraceae bacterium TaxID=1162706 RepID=A0A6J4TNA0_9ACTN|nr:MAG: hypothetical protein AVDCRST_MAG85-3408 [uncultured Solirubrobacteraceae bacterium]